MLQHARAYPGVDVRLSAAEELPYPDGAFDATLAQLVVHFMTDPVAGLTEMARVTRPDGVVGACVWDFAGGRAPISAFWQAARELDSGAEDESRPARCGRGSAARVVRVGGATTRRGAELSAAVDYESFDEWWGPYGLGVGPAGAYARALSETGLAALRERCRDLLPEAPFTVRASAWAARGLA